MTVATPKTLQARKLTIAQAIDQWTETKRAIDGLTPLMKQAADVLIEHGKKTGRRTFKDRVAMVRTGGNVVFDQEAATEFILASGRRLEDFQKTSKRGWSLKLLK